MRQRLVLLPLAFFLVLACDKANPVAPSGSVLTVTANPTQIGLNGASQITVTGFRPDGNVLFPGTQINLSTDLGILAEPLITIGDNGRGSTTLRADGRPGTATVTASLPAGEATATATIQVGEEGIQPTLTLGASPSRINVEQDSTISVLARSIDGSPLPNAQVRLRTTLGRLDAESLTTGAGGEARTRLHPGDRSGNADVTGSVGSSAEETIQVTILASQVIVDVFPRIVDIGDTAEVTIQLRDEDSVPLVAGHEVRLTANLGTLDPETVTTDSQGVGTATYTAGTRAGNDTITAFFSNATPGTDSVDLRSAPATLTLNASTTTIPPNQESTITFTATVADGEGILLSNELVTFTVQAGISATFSPGAAVSTDSGGRATVSVTFVANTLPPAGTRFNVTATARGGVSDTEPILVQ